MNKDKIFKYILVLLVVIFLALFLSQSTGYYAYNNFEKLTLTEEGIKKFEQDIKEGKEINPDNYLKKDNDYQNNISKIFLNISNTIGKYLRKGITSIFKKISSLID